MEEAAPVEDYEAARSVLRRVGRLVQLLGRSVMEEQKLFLVLLKLIFYFGPYFKVPFGMFLVLFLKQILVFLKV